MSDTAFNLGPKTTVDNTPYPKPWPDLPEKYMNVHDKTLRHPDVMDKKADYDMIDRHSRRGEISVDEANKAARRLDDTVRKVRANLMKG